MDQIQQFREEVESNISGLAADKDLQALSRIWVREVTPHKWAYNFTWLGRPAIQFPTDAWALQEIIWATRPDLIIETGIAHGGSLLNSASMLCLLDYADAVMGNGKLDIRQSSRKVLGIDIDIRPHNRQAITEHPLAHKIQMLEGSSIDSGVIEKVQQIAAQHARVMVCLDSNHTHDHVLAELEAYAPLVSAGCYCCVFDTLIEDMPDSMFNERPWRQGNNPKTAVWAFQQRLNTDEIMAADGRRLIFEIDKKLESKLQITVAPDGYLKRV